YGAGKQYIYGKIIEIMLVYMTRNKEQKNGKNWLITVDVNRAPQDFLSKLKIAVRSSTKIIEKRLDYLYRSNICIFIITEIYIYIQRYTIYIQIFTTKNK
ncbi:hypothetical protein ACJX0J_021886, partial [Zea mays]